MRTLIKASNLGKSYRQGKEDHFVLRHINLSFPGFGMVGIQGKSGSGKSTLLNLLAGLETPSEGRVYFAGDDLAEMGTKKKSKFHSADSSFVFQHYNLIEDQDVLLNVMLPLLMAGEKERNSKQKARNTLSKFGLKEFADRKVSTLSGGEKQRVALARSLVNDPLVIFADEPTGALDEANAEIVMEALKEASKTRLVLLVSHNASLLQKYADEIIEIADGGMVGAAPEMRERRPIEIRQGRRGSGRWKERFFLRNLGKDWGKNLMAFLSGSIGFACLILCFGFFHGSPLALTEESKKSLSYPVARICRRTEIEIPNSPLKMVQEVRPTREEAAAILDGISYLSIENDYSFFLPSASLVTLDGLEAGSASFAPVFDLTLKEWGASLLIDGRKPKANDLKTVLVNEAFVSQYGSCLGKMVETPIHADLLSDGTEDEIDWTFEGRIVGVVEEFSFLSVPTVYYSYQGLQDHLSNIALPNISEKRGRDTNPVDVCEGASGDSCFASYGFLVFAHDEASAASMNEMMEKGDIPESFSLDSTPRRIAESFQSLSSAFRLALVLFVAIALIGLILILGMAAYSNFVSRIKEGAILMVLGARESHLRSLYCDEGMLVNFLSAGFALAVSPWVIQGVNKFLAGQFGMESLIRFPYESYLGIPYFLVFVLLLAGLLIGYLAVMVPLLIHRRIPIAKELRDE